MQTKTMLLMAGSIAGIMLAGLLGLMFVAESLAREYPEKVYREMNSPDGAAKLIITHYKQYFPYGVKGYIYLEKNSERKKVAEFFVDFIQDLEEEKQTTVKWSEEEIAFYYGTEKLGAN